MYVINYSPIAKNINKHFCTCFMSPSSDICTIRSLTDSHRCHSAHVAIVGMQISNGNLSILRHILQPVPGLNLCHVDAVLSYLPVVVLGRRGLP